MRNAPEDSATELLASWAADVAPCFDPLQSQRALDNVSAALKNLVAYDYTTCLILRRDAAPLFVFGELPRGQEPVPYGETPYVLDPLYQHFEAGTLPLCCSLREIMPDAFEQSEFFSYYYDHAEAFDEFSFNIPLHEGTVAHVAMTRTGDAALFTGAEQARFIAVEPLVSRVVLTYAQTRYRELGLANPDAHSFHMHMRGVLDRFGSSYLTDREKQVLRMSWRGYSDLLSADKLEIQPSTLRNHKKSIFRKLGVTSQGQIFALLIKALNMPAEDIEGVDPLELLLEPRLGKVVPLGRPR